MKTVSEEHEVAWMAEGMSYQAAHQATKDIRDLEAELAAMRAKLPDGLYEVRGGKLRPAESYCKANGCHRWKGDGAPACGKGCFAAKP